MENRTSTWHKRAKKSYDCFCCCRTDANVGYVSEPKPFPGKHEMQSIIRRTDVCYCWFIWRAVRRTALKLHRQVLHSLPTYRCTRCQNGTLNWPLAMFLLRSPALPYLTFFFGFGISKIAPLYEGTLRLECSSVVAIGQGTCSEYSLQRIVTHTFSARNKIHWSHWSVIQSANGMAFDKYS